MRIYPLPPLEFCHPYDVLLLRMSMLEDMNIQRHIKDNNLLIWNALKTSPIQSCQSLTNNSNQLNLFPFERRNNIQIMDQLWKKKTNEIL